MKQIERHNDIIEKYDPLWRTTIQDDMYRFTDSKVTIMTYQKFGILCYYYPQFAEKLKLIICDEFHNVFWQSAGKAKGENECGSRFAIRALKERMKDTSALLLALTATPGQVYKHFSDKSINHILPDKPVQEYETFNIL